MQLNNGNINNKPLEGQGVFPKFPGGVPGQGGFQNFPPQPKSPKTEDKEGLKAKIKSVFEDKFVVVKDDKYLYATSENTNKGDTFRLIIDGNKVKLREVDGSFIRVDDRDFLIADTNKKGATEFTIYKTDDREYGLKAPNGYFVRVREKDNRLVARAVNIGPRTRFKFRRVD